MMFVSNDVGYLFDLQITGRKEVRRSLKPVLSKQHADIQARIPLEQTLEMGSAQARFKRQLTDAGVRPRIDERQDLVKASIANYWCQ